MRKNQVEKFALKPFIFLGLIFLVFTCQKDDTSNGIEKSITIQEPKITTIENFGLTDSRFNSLKEALNLDVYLKSKSALAQSRTTQDTLGLTIATDIIKQVTLGDYTSYTMEVVQATDSTVFYNLTIEYKNGETGMFVTKYTPTQYWLDNTNELYQGEIETARINELTEYTEVDQMFDENLIGGDNNTGLGSGVGGSNDNYTPQGSPYYPTDCGGTVIITIESIPYQCTCEDHWPGGDCYCGQNGNPGSPPGYTQVPYYTCIDYGYGDPVDGSTDTSTAGGQTLEGDDPTEDDGSIAAMIKPEECTEHIVGDLDSDCTLSPYEVCLLNGYNQDVCDCVALGNQLSDCVDDATNCSAPDDIFNSYYSNLSPFNVDLSNLRAPCDETIDTTNVAENAKFMCIYNKLTQSPKFKDLFIDTFGESANLNVKFKLDDTLPNTTGGVTGADPSNPSQIVNGVLYLNLIIRMNKNTFDPTHPAKSSTIEIAKNILHECIHAFLYVKKYNCNDGTTFDMLNNQLLGELINEYYDGTCEVDQEQHEFMFDYMIPTMMEILDDVKDNLIPQSNQDYVSDLDYNNSIYPNNPFTESHLFNWSEFYENLSMAGLHNTTTFQQFIASDSIKNYLFYRYAGATTGTVNQFSKDYCNE